MELLVAIIVLGSVILFAKWGSSKLVSSENNSEINHSNIDEAERLLKENGYEIKKKQESSGCLKFLMGFAVILGVLLMIIFIGDGINKPSSPGEKTYSKTYSNDYASKLEAYSYAENWVKDKLKSPSSAKFPDSERKVNDTEYYGDNTYKIKSYVESQNSFGAMIKTNFSCTISFKDGSVYCNDLILY